MTTPTLLYIRK